VIGYLVCHIDMYLHEECRAGNPIDALATPNMFPTKHLSLTCRFYRVVL
jgi:hypothetical protein